VQAVEQEGLSRRQAADRFEIGIKTAIEWVRRFRETGSLAAKLMGGCRPKKIIGQHRDWLLERCRRQDFTAARPGRRAGRARLAGRLQDGLGLRSQ
jgi:putative transposase